MLTQALFVVELELELATLHLWHDGQDVTHHLLARLGGLVQRSRRIHARLGVEGVKGPGETNSITVFSRVEQSYYDKVLEDSVRGGGELFGRGERI